MGGCGCDKYGQAVPTVTTQPFERHHLDDAALLLASRHRAHRIRQPLLSPVYEDPASALVELTHVFDTVDASGAVGMSNGEMVGYVLGAPKSDSRGGGTNMWVEAAGYAATDVEAVRDIYAAAAQRWFDAGRTYHFVLAPAGDPTLDAWFRLGFGQQHAHAVCAPGLAVNTRPPDSTSIRRARREDIPVMAELSMLLPRQVALAPVFCTVDWSLKDELQELEESFEDGRFVNFVAEVDGQVVGLAIGCAVDASSGHTSLALPPYAGFLGFAAVVPWARGRGVGRLLGRTVIDWSADFGFSCVVTDWRVPNLSASRTWPRLGFELTFLRLCRNIGRSG